MVIREVVVSMASFACGVLGNLILPVGPYGTPILVGPSWRDSYLLWIVKVLEPIMVLLVFGVGVRSTSLPAYFLGLIFWTVSLHTFNIFSWYVCVLAFFHFSEYIITGVTNPRNLNFDSYLINHSVQYWLAAVASWLEFWIEYYFLPEMKSFWLISLLGLFTCVAGEVTRKLAMVHAGSNFNHVVQSVKQQDHRLVKSGIYSLCRHPSYVGWFWWSLGTQLILVNPVCLVLYFIASFSFFKERIYVEEYMLLQFFGKEYHAYQQNVPTGIPCIQGYVVDHWD